LIQHFDRSIFYLELYMAIVATHVAAVQELYVAYFGRPADVAGLDYWTNVVEAQGGSTTAVSASFATQPEYIAAFFGKTNAQVVDQIYANMFARGASTTDGRSYWVDLLNKGTVGVSTIVAEVANGAKGTDATAVENKVEAATAFTNALDTEAEQAGYNGTDALTLAKAWITGITTDATLTAAIATPALNATVAGVVKAGTPFTLNSALAELQTANKALTEFLEDNNLPATAAAAKIAVDGEVAAATTAVDALVAGTYDPATAIGRGALADQQTANATALKDANTALTNANTAAAAVTGLSAAIANKAAAVEARDAAIEAAAATQTELVIAENTLETRTGGTLTTTVPAADAAAGVVVVSMPDPDSTATPAPTINLIVTGARGSLVLANGVTEADYPGVTALRDALSADIYADRDAAAATLAATTASNATVLTANTGLVTAVENAQTAVNDAQDDIDALAEAVADRAEAVAQQTEFTNLNKAVTDAGLAFTTNGFRTPVELDLATAAGTTASDIFMLGDADTVSITSFGRQGEDSLYVGTNYVLNTGTLESGNNSAMEVFFVQNGTRAEVHVEKAAYGSSSDDTIVITLVGVDATDLQLVDGIISLKETTV
jgi:hypothetical protein